MTLTALDVLAHCRRRLDGAPSMAPVSLANLAGRHLVGMNAGGWSWMLRPPAPLRLHAGSTRMKLPADYQKTAALESVWSGSGKSLAEVDVQTMACLRARSTSPIGVAYYALLLFDVDQETKLMAPYFELYPKPSADDSTSFKLWYFGRWRDVQKDDDEVPLPPSESVGILYLEIADAIARGHDEHDEGSIAQRMMALRASTLYMDALGEDGSRVTGPFPMKGGMVQQGVGSMDWSLYPESLGGPGS